MTYTKHVLITGATGFIGRFLVDKVKAHGYHVVAAIRKSSNTDYLDKNGIEHTIIDFTDKYSYLKAIDQHQITHIINNAGLTRAKSQTELDVVNADYVSVLVEAINDRASQIKKFVHISSLAAYGPAEFTPNGVVSNKTTPHPVTMYGRSKLKGEEVLKKNISQVVPYIIIRPTAVYGPYEKDLFTVFKTINKGIQAKVGFKAQKLTFVYVEDLVSYITEALSSNATNKAYFISENQHYSTHQLNEYIRQALGKNTFKVTLPISLMYFISLISQLVGNITGKVPPLTLDKMNEIKAQSWVCDCTDNHELNHTPQFDLETGIAQTVAWYKENKWL